MSFSGSDKGAIFATHVDVTVVHEKKICVDQLKQRAALFQGMKRKRSGKTRLPAVRPSPIIEARPECARTTPGGLSDQALAERKRKSGDSQRRVKVLDHQGCGKGTDGEATSRTKVRC
jgi:hypothetical protein